MRHGNMDKKPQGIIDLVAIICEIERGYPSLDSLKEAIRMKLPRERDRMLADDDKIRTMKWILDEYSKFYGWE